MAPSSPVAVASADRWYLRSVVDGGRNENRLQGGKNHCQPCGMTGGRERTYKATVTPTLTRIKRLCK